MWQKYSPNLTILDQPMGGRREKTKKRERKIKKRSSTFSLDFPAIGRAVVGGVRRKMLPRIESFK